MAAASIVKGKQQPFRESRRISQAADGYTETIVIAGKFSDLENELAKYPYGSKYGTPVTVAEVAGEDGTVTTTKRQLYVTSAAIQGDGNGFGKLTLSCTANPEVTQGETQINAPVREKWTVAMQMQNMSLAEHKNFPAGNAKEWALFIASPASVQSQNQYCTDPEDATTAVDLPGGLSAWANLYNKGVQNFMWYGPVVTKVSVYGYFPYSVIGKIGTKDVPSQFSALAEQWLKTADDLEEDESTGNWRRTEQWTGAHEWPDILYSGN